MTHLWLTFLIASVLLARASSHHGNNSHASTQVPTTHGTSTFKPALPSDTSPCTMKQLPNPGPPLPKLDQQFETRVEGNIVSSKYSVNLVEYYDYKNNRGALYRTKNGVDSGWIYNFKTYESFIIQGQQCTRADLNEKGFHFFNFTHTKRGGHIGGVADLFNFGTIYNETFVGGNNTIRGIPVNHWTSCIEWKQAIFNLDYYFSKPDYNTSVGKREIPVRAVLKGTTKPINQQPVRKFHHVYEFVFYRPGPIRDLRVFEVPHGVVCRPKSKMPDRPDLPDQFSLHIEQVYATRKHITSTKRYFDYKSKFARFDYTPDKNDMSEMGKKFGVRPLRIIHDYNTGLQYVLDQVRLNCTVDKISNHSFDVETVPGDSIHVQMRRGYQLFDLNKMKFAYQGERQVREIPCDVWAAVRTKWPSPSENATVELYFAKSGWTTESDKPATEHRILLGMWMHMKDPSQNYSLQLVDHVYEYVVGQPNINAFDIRRCYDGSHQMKHLVFRIEGSYLELVSNNLYFTHTAVHHAVAATAKVTPIRVTDIYFDATSVKYVDVWFTLLNKPPMKGDVKNPVKSISMDEAFENLKAAINSPSGMTFQVKFSDKKTKVKTVRVKQKSLATDKELLDPRKPLPPCTYYEGYSAGAMAGLGIAMSVIGTIIGLGIAFFLWRRGTGIPYQVQD